MVFLNAPFVDWSNLDDGKRKSRSQFKATKEERSRGNLEAFKLVKEKGYEN